MVVLQLRRATGPASDAAPDEGPPRAPLLGGRALAVALALVVLPLVVSAVHMMVVRNDLHPTSDLAATELITRDVGHRAVLLGPFSRDGWHHPGPLSNYLYAVPYRLLGSTAAGMNVAALLVNAASVAGMAIVARRRGGAPLALATLVVCALLVRTLGPDLLRVPWNPYVTVLPFGLLVFLTWALLDRDRWALPFAVLTASFVAQTHVGYVALGLPLLALGALGLLVGALRDRDGHGEGEPGWLDRLRPLVGPVVAAAAVGAVAWAPPLYQQVRHDPGNLGLILDWFRTGGGGGQPAQGWANGWRLVSGQYDVVPEWVGGMRPAGFFTGEPEVLDHPVLPILLPLVVVAVVLLARRHVTGAWALGVAWLAASVAGVVATARVIGPVYAYRTGWAIVLGGVGGLAVAWCVGREVAHRAPDAVRRLLAPATLAGLAVLAVVSSVTYARAGVPEPEWAEQLGAVAPDTLAALPPGDDPVVVDGRMGWGGAIQAPGLALELERHGVPTRLPGSTVAGVHRIEDGGPVRAHLVVTTGPAIPVVADTEGRTLVAYSGDLSLDEVRDRLARREPVADDAATAVFLVTG